LLNLEYHYFLKGIRGVKVVSKSLLFSNKDYKSYCQSQNKYLLLNTSYIDFIKLYIYIYLATFIDCYLPFFLLNADSRHLSSIMFSLNYYILLEASNVIFYQLIHPLNYDNIRPSMSIIHSITSSHILFSIYFIFVILLLSISPPIFIQLM